MPKSASLSLAMPNPVPSLSSSARSPASSDTLRSNSPSSPHCREELTSDASFNVKDSGDEPILPATSRDDSHGASDIPTSPTFTSLPPFPTSPTSPTSAPKHGRDASRSFFSNLKASKSSIKIQPPDATIRQVANDSQSQAKPNEIKIYKIPSSSNSTPDLTSLQGESGLSDITDGHDHSDYTIRPKLNGVSAVSDSVLLRDISSSVASKSRTKFGPFLTRTPSLRLNEGARRSKPTTPIRTRAPEFDEISTTDESIESGGLKTAPLQRKKDYYFGEMMAAAPRNRSADRQPGRYPSPLSDRGEAPSRRGDGSRDRSHGLTASASQVFRSDGAGGHLLSGIKHTTTKAAEGFGKASNRIMGKMTRNGGSNHKDVVEEQPYVCHIITLPLREQTRRTRIAKRLENSKDKTEFWMPSLPWRCIDYLNFRGCDEEGLYRVPGSGPKVKEYQQRFDRELDINLFTEPELYDVNIIGSMFKAWLRDLPDEIFPKATQEMISKVYGEPAENPMAPQMLKDELSMLPPWNYYLLFAITCHLSLLHAYVDKNKMTFHNLAICFAPSLKMNHDCFRWLVCDWRNCWQGCWTEQKHLVDEYYMIDLLESRAAESSGGSTAVEDRSLSSSGSGKQAQKPPPLTITQPSKENLSSSTDLRKSHHGRSASHLPEISLAPPLSPIGL